MTPEAVLSIILATLGVLGSAGFWGYKQSRKEAPIKKRDADLAVADKSQQMAMAIATRLDTELLAMKADLTTERGERQTLGGRVDELAAQVREQDRTITGLREVVRSFSSAWDSLVRDWHILRLEESPPPKPHTHNP